MVSTSRQSVEYWTFELKKILLVAWSISSSTSSALFNFIQAFRIRERMWLYAMWYATIRVTHCLPFHFVHRIRYRARDIFTLLILYISSMLLSKMSSRMSGVLHCIAVYNHTCYLKAYNGLLCNWDTILSLAYVYCSHHTCGTI